MEQFHGLSAFPVTPSDEDGRVDTAHLQRLVENLDRDGIFSIGVMGSTGGYMYHSAAERARAVRAAVEATEKAVLAGIGAMRTSEVIAHAKGAEAAGASGLLLAPVSYLPLTDNDVEGLFRDAAAATGLPILIYNNPRNTHFTISEDLLARLAAIDGVDAIKNPPAPDGDFAGQMARLRAATSEGFSLGYSGDSAISGALRAGADAWYSVLAGTLPDIAVSLWAARKDAGELRRLNDTLSPLYRLFDRYGSIRVIHEVTAMVGLGKTQLPRPLQPLSKDARKEIEAALEVVEAAKCVA